MITQNSEGNWVDENKNVWTTISKEEAEDASESLKSCTHCTDCFDCTNCHLCTECVDCSNLEFEKNQTDVHEPFLASQKPDYY